MLQVLKVVGFHPDYHTKQRNNGLFSLFYRYKAFHGDQHPMVVKSTENIRALTTKLVKVAQERTSSTQQKYAPAAGVPEGGVTCLLYTSDAADE